MYKAKVYGCWQDAEEDEERDCEQTTLKTQWADTLMKGLL